LIGSAGGAPSNNFVMSLRESGDRDHLIGMCAVPSDLMLADVDERYVVPYATAPDYFQRLQQVITKSRPDLIHAQHDFEVRELSRRRAEITAMGAKLFLPDAETVENCVDKARSYEIWKRAGLTVPETLLVTDEAVLREAFQRFGGKVWLRATEGGGGKGALPADDFEFARMWIQRFKGWGSFTAAECLTPNSITWLSIWYQGELVVAQTRRRLSWNFGDRTLSGVTGVTGVGETCSIPLVDETSMATIAAIDKKPHGIFAVDMTYDQQGRPNPTEINIGRFFTTHHFFTKAGVNFPKIYRDLALEGRFPTLPRKINPLPDGLLWIRGMDVPPLLTTVDALRALADG
jgi:carbamoyl-phosphate synthase large subunit